MLSVLNFRFTFLQKSMTFFLFLRNNLKEVKDERPSLLCMKVPDTACAVAYDRCHRTLIFPICRTHQKHLSLVQNALVAGNLCCRKVDASSAIGALIGDTGQLLPYHRHAPSAQEQRHQHWRNDMDVVGVRAGCTFTGFSGSSFDGNSVMVRAEQSDHWVVFDRFFYPFICGSMSAPCLPLCL